MRGIPDRLEEQQNPLARSWSIAKTTVKNLAAVWSVLASVAVNVVGALLFAGLLYLLYQAVIASTIEVLPIAVPKNLADQGYTSEAVSLQLREALLDLVRDAQTTKSTANVVKQGDDPAIELPQTGMSLDTIAAQIRTRFGLGNSWKISGNIESDDERLTLNISLDGNKEYRKLIINGRKHSVDDLFSSAARKIYDVIDPYVVASSLADKDPQKSVALARQIIATHPASDPDVAWAHVLISFVTLPYSPLEAAKEAKAAIALNQNIEAAHYNLAESLFNQNKTGEAMEEIKQAIALDPSDADAYDLFGQALEKDGKLESAIDAFKGAVAVDPSDANAYFDLGSALQQKGKLDAAVGAFNKAISADPSDAAAYVRLGSALEQQGKLDEAVDAFNGAIASHPRASDFHVNP